MGVGSPERRAAGAEDITSPRRQPPVVILNPGYVVAPSRYYPKHVSPQYTMNDLGWDQFLEVTET